MNDEVNESIEVVSASASHTSTASSSNTTDNQAIQAIRDSSNMSSMVTVNEENECYNLETELKSTRARLAEVSAENETLKRRLEVRRRRVVSNGGEQQSARSLSESEFVDVNSLSIAEKIEHHLGETDAIFAMTTSGENSDDDTAQFYPAMEYLVKNLWSIIAHEYDEKSLQSTRLIRDSLLGKLQRVNEMIACARTASLLEAELETLKKDTYSLREKVIKQNQLIKSLVGSIPLNISSGNSIRNDENVNVVNGSSSFSSTSIQVLSHQSTGDGPGSGVSISKSQLVAPPATTSASSSTTNTNGTNGKDGDDETEEEYVDASPSVSPSQSLANHLNRVLNQKRNVAEVRSIEPASQTFAGSSNGNDNDEDKETLQHESTTQEARPNQQTRGQMGDIFLHAMGNGEYFGISREDEIGHMLSSPAPSPSSTSASSSSGSNNREAVAAAALNGLSPSSAVYQCPTCKITVDPKTIAWEVFSQHTRQCDITRHSVCMFCLRQFPKDRPQEYEEHVQGHMDTFF